MFWSMLEARVEVDPIGGGEVGGEVIGDTKTKTKSAVFESYTGKARYEASV